MLHVREAEPAGFFCFFLRVDLQCYASDPALLVTHCVAQHLSQHLYVDSPPFLSLLLFLFVDETDAAFLLCFFLLQS